MKTAHFIKPDKTFTQNLGSNSLNFTSAIGQKFKLEQIIFNFSQPITETISIYNISPNGVNYNGLLESVDLISESKYVYRPQGECNFQAGEELNVQCTNANGIGIVYATLKTSEL